jgi:hypothetical protein
VRLIAITIAMYWVVDKFGRTKLLMGGSALAVSGRRSWQNLGICSDKSNRPLPCTPLAVWSSTIQSLLSTSLQLLPLVDTAPLSWSMSMQLPFVSRGQVFHGFTAAKYSRK